MSYTKRRHGCLTLSGAERRQARRKYGLFRRRFRKVQGVLTLQKNYNSRRGRRMRRSSFWSLW